MSAATGTRFRTHQTVNATSLSNAGSLDPNVYTGILKELLTMAASLLAREPILVYLQLDMPFDGGHMLAGLWLHGIGVDPRDGPFPDMKGSSSSSSSKKWGKKVKEQTADGAWDAAWYLIGYRAGQRGTPLTDYIGGKSANGLAPTTQDKIESYFPLSGTLFKWDSHLPSFNYNAQGEHVLAAKPGLKMDQWTLQGSLEYFAKRQTRPDALVQAHAMQFSTLVALSAGMQLPGHRHKQVMGLGHGSGLMSWQSKAVIASALVLAQQWLALAMVGTMVGEDHHKDAHEHLSRLSVFLPEALRFQPVADAMEALLKTEAGPLNTWTDDIVRFLGWDKNKEELQRHLPEAQWKALRDMHAKGLLTVGQIVTIWSKVARHAWDKAIETEAKPEVDGCFLHLSLEAIVAYFVDNFTD